MNSTNNSPEVRAIRKDLLAEVAVLQAAIKDPNALMAGGTIFGSMERIGELRTKYATAAGEAHTAWCARNP